MDGATVDSQRFVDALGEIEKDGTIEPMVQLFADDARIWNPLVHEPISGPAEIRQFWTVYKNTFADVRSEIRTVVEAGTKSALEWESSGTLQVNRQPFRYRGASILEWTDGKITRFFAYFDPRALTVE